MRRFVSRATWSTSPATIVGRYRRYANVSSFRGYHSGSVSQGWLRLEKALCFIAKAERPPRRSVDIGGDAARRHSVFARADAQPDND
jgi:hypothetical protein